MNTLKTTCQTTTNDAGTSITFSGFDQMLNLGQMGETFVLEVKWYTQINWNHSKFSQKVLWLAPTRKSLPAHCTYTRTTWSYVPALNKAEKLLDSRSMLLFCVSWKCLRFSFPQRQLTKRQVGVTEPTATFSACFGAPFMVWHPAKYAELLADKTLGKA